MLHGHHSRITLTGRVSCDPDTIHLPNGAKATDLVIGQQHVTIVHEAFARMALDACRQGTQVRAQAEIKPRSFRENGNNAIHGAEIVVSQDHGFLQIVSNRPSFRRTASGQRVAP